MPAARNSVKTQKLPRKPKTKPTASYNDICNKAQANAKKHGKSKKTNQQYDAYIDRSRVWLASFQTEGKKSLTRL